VEQLKQFNAKFVELKKSKQDNNLPE